MHNRRAVDDTFDSTPSAWQYRLPAEIEAKIATDPDSLYEYMEAIAPFVRFPGLEDKLLDAAYTTMDLDIIALCCGYYERRRGTKSNQFQSDENEFSEFFAQLTESEFEEAQQRAGIYFA